MKWSPRIDGPLRSGSRSPLVKYTSSTCLSSDCPRSSLQSLQLAEGSRNYLSELLGQGSHLLGSLRHVIVSAQAFPALLPECAGLGWICKQRLQAAINTVPRPPTARVAFTASDWLATGFTRTPPAGILRLWLTHYPGWIRLPSVWHPSQVRRTRSRTGCPRPRENAWRHWRSCDKSCMATIRLPLDFKGSLR
jgi:hypothetical protein